MIITDDEDEAAVQKTKDLLPAKTASKAAQVFAALWVITLTILKGFRIIQLEVDEIIYTAVAIVGIFSPVYISIWLEKIRDIRFGKQR